MSSIDPLRPGGPQTTSSTAPHAARNQIILMLLGAVAFTIWWVALALGMTWSEVRHVLIAAALLLLAGLLMGVRARRRAADEETDNEAAPSTGRGPEP